MYDDVYSFEYVWRLAVLLTRGVVVQGKDRTGLTYSAGPPRSAVGPDTWVLIRWANGGEPVAEGDAFDVALAYYRAVDFNETSFSADEALERAGQSCSALTVWLEEPARAEGSAP